MWSPLSDTLSWNGPFPARIILVITRVTTNVTTNAAKQTNSGTFTRPPMSSSSSSAAATAPDVTGRDGATFDGHGNSPSDRTQDDEPRGLRRLGGRNRPALRPLGRVRRTGAPARQPS